MEIGRRLRFLREQRGITLDQISERTHIDRRYLLAIENGQFYLFPSEHHVKSCLRAYSMCIGVNPQSVLQAYSLSTGATQPRIAPVHARSVPDQTQPRLPLQRRQTAQFRKQDHVEEGKEKEFVEVEVAKEVEEPQLSRRRSRKAKKGRAGALFDRLLVLLAILLLICGGIVFYLRMSTDEVSLDSQAKFLAETHVQPIKLS